MDHQTEYNEKMKLRQKKQSSFKVGKDSTYVTTNRLNKCTKKQTVIWIFQRSRTINGIKATIITQEQYWLSENCHIRQ